MGYIEQATRDRVEALQLGDDQAPRVELACHLARCLDAAEEDRSMAQLSKEFRAVLAELEAAGASPEDEGGAFGDVARFTAR